jgi:septum formation protein
MTEWNQGQELRLVLASTSPRRRQMLEALDIDFELIPPAPEAELPLPRHLPQGRLHEQLIAVAESKTLDVARRCPPGCLVVGADTVVYAQGQVLVKPIGRANARDHLRKLSGRAHRVLTAVCVARSGGGEKHSRVEVTEVRFRALSEGEIEGYVATGEPLDKAGSYGIQGWGGLLVETIKGRFDNVVGFPLVTLNEALDHFGASLMQFRRC